MPHRHGCEYQVKVIHEDGTEALSEWIQHTDVAQTMASLRKPQVKAFWLRERTVAVSACALCKDRETEITEYPLADSQSSRFRARSAGR
jgi:hypothetical protein